jgi:hypothetical protein
VDENEDEETEENGKGARHGLLAHDRLEHLFQGADEAFEDRLATARDDLRRANRQTDADDQQGRDQEARKDRVRDREMNKGREIRRSGATLARVSRRGEGREERQRDEGFEGGSDYAGGHGKRGKEHELGSRGRVRQSWK